ncbi:MAG: arylamine N-acetyltransferase [Devosia sp.]|nr:arylamine N-acetyltransferase [Devosia sp.]
MPVALEANIDAYFERIGFAGSIAPTLETLSQLCALHTAAIPYENLDPVIGAPVRLELANLQQKLLFDGRGGYCFEHNLLFKAVLETLDFEVRVHPSRVIWGHEEDAEPPLRHIVLTVEVAGVSYLVDAGFGGQTPTAPLRMRSGLEQETPLERFRLNEQGGTWTLQIEIGEGWHTLYDFSLSACEMDQIIRMNEAASSSGFLVDNLLVARAEKARRLALFNRRYNTHVPGEPSIERTVGSAAELRDLLCGPFGLQLPADPRIEAVLERITGTGAA